MFVRIEILLAQFKYIPLIYSESQPDDDPHSVETCSSMNTS